MPSDDRRADRLKARRRSLLLSLGAVTAMSGLAACQFRPPAVPTTPTAVRPTPPPTATALPATAVPTATTQATATPVPPTPTAVATATPVPRALTWWTARSDELWLKAAQEATTRFNLAQSGINAAVSGGHTDFGKIVGAFSSGQAPNVVEPGAFAPLAARGIIRPLQPYLTGGGIGPANYFDQMWKNGSWRGKTYAIPALDHGPELGLIWNESLLMGGPPATLSDLYAFARRQTRQDASGAIQFLGLDPLDGVGGLLDTARDLVGQDWIDLASRAVRLASPPYQSFLAALGSYCASIGADHLDGFRQAHGPMTDAADSAVNQGTQGAILTGYWSVGEIGRLNRDPGWKFSSTWAPTVAPGSQVQRMGGLVLTIPEVAKDPDDGWALIEHLAGDETNGIFLDRVGTFAATHSFIGLGSWKKSAGLEFWIDSLGQATHLTSRSDNDVASLAQERWNQAIADVLVGHKSPADALNASQAAIQSDLVKLST